MHLPDPAGIAVDPALILAAEDRRERSARAMAAAAARFVDQRATTEARIRAAVLAYAATAHHPIDRLVMDRLAARPAL